MKIALRAFSLSLTLDSSETPKNFSSTAFHSPCNTKSRRLHPGISQAKTRPTIEFWYLVLYRRRRYLVSFHLASDQRPNIRSKLNRPILHLTAKKLTALKSSS